MLSIGKIIKKERKAQKITQETLCAGICTASYLSRIESGNVNSSVDVIENLMQRLGKDISRYVNYKNERDFDIDNLKHDIRRSYATGKYDLHKDLLKDLISIADSGNKSLQQFIMLHTSFIEKRNGTAPLELLAMLEKALALTLNKINILDLKQELLTQDEVIIINGMAINNKNMGNLDKGIEILLELKKYLDHSRIDYEEKRRTYPVVICNLTKWLSKAKRYYECIAMCDIAIEYCIKYDSLEILPDANFNKGFALKKLGNTKEAIEYITKSYYVAKASKNEKFASLTKEYILETFEIHL